jgi:hypothetical protein
VSRPQPLRGAFGSLDTQTSRLGQNQPAIPGQVGKTKQKRLPLQKWRKLSSFMAETPGFALKKCTETGICLHNSYTAKNLHAIHSEIIKIRKLDHPLKMTSEWTGRASEKRR